MGGEGGTSVEDRKFKILLARHKRDKALKTIIILLCILMGIYLVLLVGNCGGDVGVSDRETTIYLLKGFLVFLGMVAIYIAQA